MKTDALRFTKKRLPTEHSQSKINYNKLQWFWQGFFI